MRSSISIRVAASAARVFDIARRVERWADLLPHYRRVAVEGRAGDRIVATMVAVRQVGPLAVPVAWRAEHWPEPADADDLRLRFRHIRGVTRGMEVTWHVRETDDGCEVTIEHVFSRPIPLLGDQLLPTIVDRFFVRHIAGRTLATFKRLAESGGEPATNHLT